MSGLTAAMERLEAIRRTGLAQAFTAADGVAVLDELEAVTRSRDALIAAATRHLAHAPCEGGSPEWCGLAELVGSPQEPQE